MNAPLAPRTPIDAKRYKVWLERFGTYRTGISAGLIDAWLSQFGQSDQDLAARLLDSVHFIGVGQLQRTFVELLGGLKGWHEESSKRKGQWYFVPFSGSTGESGDAMLHQFRMSNGLAKRKFNPLFIHRSELVAKRLGPDDTVVLIDDFSGSGDQACDSWKEFFAELLTGQPRIILMLVAATSQAIQRIANETDMEPLCGVVMKKSDNFFDNECKVFSTADKATVITYCKKADGSRPKGHGNCGLLLVICHRCPNNSVPILHASHNNWQGLFPRS